MSLRQIFSNFSWDTLLALQPTELLSLVVLAMLLLGVIAVSVFLIFYRGY